MHLVGYTLVHICDARTLEHHMYLGLFHLIKEAVCFRNVVYCFDYFYDSGKISRTCC